MGKTVSAIACAVFGTAIRHQTKHGVPRSARYWAEAISWGAGVMALWLLDAPGWAQTILVLVVVNAVAWLLTAIYFLIWSDRIHQFRRTKGLLREMVADATDGATTNFVGNRAAMVPIMERLTRANVLIRKGFSHRINSDYEAFKNAEIARRGSNDLFPVIAEYGTRLLDEMRFDDLNPRFDPPRSLSNIDPWKED